MISVVIPTCRRPVLLQRALRSVTGQTFGELEVVVVAADPDADTQQAVASFGDRRVRMIEGGGRLTSTAARNLGVRNATRDWIAFLDDDDHWLPDKLRRQLEVGMRSRFELPIVSCGMLARDGETERRWPRRVPREGEAIGDYLFRRTSLLGADGFLQTSTLLAPRRLCLDVPFREFHPVEDLDWVLRAGRQKNAGVEFVLAADGKTAEPLAVWNIDPGREHESQAHGWRASLAWIVANAGLIGPEAYASFLLTWVSRDAAHQGAGLAGAMALWREAVRNGRPTPLATVLHLVHLLVPPAGLNRLSGRLTGQSVVMERE